MENLQRRNFMRRTFLFMGAVTLVAILLNACGPATIVSSAALPPQRTLTVTGTGTVQLSPDVAYINVGVHTEMPTASEAVSSNTDQSQQVIDALKNAGVDPKDIQTTNFSIYPNNQTDPQTGKQIGTTYVVENTVYVTVHQLDKLGSLLDATVKAGANSVNSIQFDVVDKSQAIQQAHDQAIKDAKAQAQAVAAAAGVSLGDLQTLSFYDNVPTPMMSAYGKGGGLAAAAPTVPISPGQMTLTTTVNMTYGIK
jgi:uncharacterized protein YggE